MDPRDELKEQILLAGLKLMNRYGYGSLTLSELARQAKITKQRLYYHFPTPDEVLMVLASDWSKTGQECTLQALAKSPEARSFKVLGMGEGMFDWLEKHAELARLGLVLHQSSPHIKKLNHFMSEARVQARARIKSFLILETCFAKMKPVKLEDVITTIHSVLYGHYFYIVAMNDFEKLDHHKRNCQESLRKLIQSYRE